MKRRARVTFEAPRATVKAGRGDADRVIKGAVVPYGVDGRTSAGRLRIRKGALRLPDDVGRVKLTYGHDRDKPIGVALAARDTTKALTMEFRPGSTELADQAYAECADQLRDSFSVELDNMTVRSGWVEAGDVVSVALLPFPAYAGTGALAAGDTDDDDDDQADDDDGDDDQADDDDAGDDDQADDDDAGDDDRDDQGQSDNGGSNVTTSTAGRRAGKTVRGKAPAGSLQAGRTKPRPTDPAKLQVLFQALSAKHTGQRLGPELEAALSDITSTANEWTTATQFAGELWSGVAYQRRFVPLVNRLPLTSWNITGWRWVVKPAVAAWSGDKTAVPSNAPTTQAVSAEAERLAGAHDVDRKFRDFGDTSFFESYYRAMSESYALLSDLALVADLEAGATPVAGVAATSLAAGIIEAILAMPDDVVPEWVIAGKDLMPDALAVTEANKPAYLNLNLLLTRKDGSTVEGLGVDFASQLNGQVLVGSRQAATFYELDPTPIRVEAVDMVDGGIDPGVFGYYATIINKATALQLKTVTP